MKKETKTMKELHKIREQIYESTKHMSIEEKVKYLNNRAAETKKRLNIKGSSTANANAGSKNGR
ncbi:MAG: hypothetical protein HQK51_09370 [Oligoflexia bacterium]|nr:hypothetical protein [Oligoflexia bacterium]